MNLIDTLDTAVRGLRSYKLRSLLTMLGLVIGVGAVIVMSALGRGVDNSVSAAIEPIANSITVTPQIAPMPGSPPSKPLTDSDERAIAQLPGVSDVVPTVTGSNTQAAGQVSKAVTASTRDAHYLSATVIGTSADYLSTSQKRCMLDNFLPKVKTAPPLQWR